jgi:hypothetical protein
MAKATDAEVEARIDRIVELVLEGATRSVIVRHCAENWGVSTRQSEEYLSRAWELIKEANDGSRPQKVSRHLKRLDRLANMAARDGQYSAAIKAYELQAKIMGIEMAPMEHEERLPDVSNEELDRVLEETRVH